MAKRKPNSPSTAPQRRPQAKSPPPPAGSSWLKSPPLPLLCLLLAALVAGTFYPALHCGFINLDDGVYVTKNLDVKGGFTKAGLIAAFTSRAGGNWHPLTWFSHMLDVQLYGLNPWGHHLTNIILHAASTVLLFLTLRRLTKSLWPSFLVAILFGIHPLRVESVVWVAERKDVLSTLFLMLTLWYYAGYAQATPTTDPSPTRNTQRATRPYILSILFFALGLMSKPMLVTTPFALLLLDYWPLSRIQLPESPSSILNSLSSTLWRLVREKTPYFILSLAACVVTYIAQDRTGAVGFELPLAGRLENALVAYARYLGKLFWPENMAIFYPHPGYWPTNAVVLSGLLFFAISIFVVIAGCPELHGFLFRHATRNTQHGPRYLPVGWFWFVGVMVPVIGVVQVGGQSMADRYSYVPSIGIFIMVVWGLKDLCSTPPFRTLAFSLQPLAFASVVACLVITEHQIPFWKDNETIFLHTAAVTQKNSLAYSNLGDGYLAQHKLDDAIAAYHKALEIRPKYPDILVNLGSALGQKGQFDEAMKQLRLALEQKPDDFDAHNNLGNALLMQGRYEEAIVDYRAALKSKPTDADAHHNFAGALLRTGQRAEAISEYREAIRLKPAYPLAHEHLGDALAEDGKFEEAVQEYQQVLGLNADSFGLRYHLGLALAKLNRRDEALSQFNAALKQNPDSKEIRDQLRALAAPQK